MAVSVKSHKVHHQDKDINSPDLPGAFELLKPSWQAISLNFITLVEFIIIPIMLSLLSSILTVHRLSNGMIATNHGFTAQWYYLNGLSTGISLLLAPGLSYTLLQGAKGQRIDFWPALKTGIKFFWRFLGVLICSGFLIIVGLILLIIPGLFMLRRYYLAPYYLLDRNLGVFETLRICKEESVKCGNAVWSVLFAQILFVAILIIPILGWIAGAILSVMYYNAPAIRYEQITSSLKSKKGAKAASPATIH